MRRRISHRYCGAFISCGWVQYAVNSVDGEIFIHVKLGLSNVDGQDGFLGRSDGYFAVGVLEEDKAVIGVESGEFVAVGTSGEVSPPEGGWFEGVVEEESGQGTAVEDWGESENEVRGGENGAGEFGSGGEC